MQNLIINPITIEHLTQYGAIYAAAFSGEPWNDNWSVEDATSHVLELLENQQHYGLECIIDGEVAGFILGTSMLFHYGRTFEIKTSPLRPNTNAKASPVNCLSNASPTSRRKEL